MAKAEAAPLERTAWDGSPVPLERFGKDHWSTFAYVETRIVDYGGWLDTRHLRGCNGDASDYPTRLRGTFGEITLLTGHDDTDCLTDLVAAGLIEGGRATKRDHRDEIVALTYQYTLTTRGHVLAGALRAHKATAGNFQTFGPLAVQALHEAGRL